MRILPRTLPYPEVSRSNPTHHRLGRDEVRGSSSLRRYIAGVPLGIGIWEILILVGVLVLLFGAKGAPGMARRLGVGVREIKDAVAEIDPRTLLDPKDEPAAAKPRPQREIEASTPVPVRSPENAAVPPETGDVQDESPAS